MRDLSRSAAIGFRAASTAGAILTVLVLASLGADGDQGPKNLDLEDGTLGQVPAGWFLPDPSREAGYAAQLTDDHPHSRAATASC